MSGGAIIVPHLPLSILARKKQNPQTMYQLGQANLQVFSNTQAKWMAPARVIGVDATGDQNGRGPERLI